VQLELVHSKLTCIAIATNHQVSAFQAQIGKNFTTYVLIDGGFGENIIIKHLKV
jgi:hypothetical protein